MTPLRPEILAAVLTAAIAHAMWNSLVKRGADKLFSSILVAGGCGTIALCALPFMPAVESGCWPFILASGALQVLYTTLLAATYRAGDFSQTYPVMRGAAPLIVAIASGPLVGEVLSPARWAGVLLISGGVAAMALLRPAGQQRPATAVGFAVLNAAVIASYTVVDGLGVRRSGAPVTYGFWTFVLAALPLVGWALASRREPFLRYARRNWPVFTVGGCGTMLSYSLVLWAMARAPVAVVASLRETSILFATAISVFVFRERVSVARGAVIAVIVLGAVVVRGL